MIWLLLYVVVGLALGYVAKVEDDRPAIFAGLAYVFLFAFLWPVVLLYFIDQTMKCGVLKYKGKVLWRAKKHL